MTDSILQWILTIIGSGGLGAAVTYFINLKSNKRIKEAEADNAVIDVQHKKLDLDQDHCDYLQRTCDKYIKDYHALEEDFRKQLQGLRESIDQLMIEKSQAISDKCVEIASLKSQVTYLKGLRCYNSSCVKRMRINPDKIVD